MHKNVNNFLISQLDLDGLKATLSPHRQASSSGSLGHKKNSDHGGAASSSSPGSINNNNNAASPSSPHHRMMPSISMRREHTGATGTSLSPTREKSKDAKKPTTFPASPEELDKTAEKKKPQRRENDDDDNDDEFADEKLEHVSALPPRGKGRRGTLVPHHDDREKEEQETTKSTSTTSASSLTPSKPPRPPSPSNNTSSGSSAHLRARLQNNREETMIGGDANNSGGSASSAVSHNNNNNMTSAGNNNSAFFDRENSFTTPSSRPGSFQVGSSFFGAASFNSSSPQSIRHPRRIVSDEASGSAASPGASSLNHLQNDLDSTAQANFVGDGQVIAAVNDSVYDHEHHYFGMAENPWRLSFPAAPDALTFDYARLLGNSYLFDSPLGHRKGEHDIDESKLQRVDSKSLNLSGKREEEEENSAAPSPSPQRRKKVAIIGAGVAGSIVARELARTGLYDVDVYESSNRVGGRMWSQRALGFRKVKDQETGEEKEETFAQLTCHEMGAMRFPLFNTSQPLKPGSGPWVGGPYHFSWQDQLGPRTAEKPVPINSLTELYLQMYEISTAAFPDPGKAPGVTLQSMVARKASTIMRSGAISPQFDQNSRAASFAMSFASQTNSPKSIKKTTKDSSFFGPTVTASVDNYNNNRDSASSKERNNNELHQQQEEHPSGTSFRRKSTDEHSTGWSSSKPSFQMNTSGKREGSHGSAKFDEALNHSHQSLDLAHVMENQLFSSEEGYEGVRTSVYVNNGWGVDLCSMYPEQFPDESCLPSKTFAYDWPADSPSILFPAAQMFPSVVWFHNGEARPDLHVPQIVLDHCIPKVDGNDLHKYIPKNFGTPETNSHYEKDVIAWSKGIDALRTTLYKWSIFSGLFLWAISNQSDGFLLDGLPIEKTEETWNQMRFDAGHANWEEFWFKKVMPHYQNKSFSSIVTAAPIIPTEKTADGRKWKCPKEILDGNFGGLGVNAGELSLLGTLGLSDGSWQPFYPLSSLWILRAILFGFANQHQLFLGACLNKKQSDVDDSRLDHIDRTPYGVSGRNQIKDSNGNDFNAPQYVGATSISEMNFFSPLDVRDLKKNKEDRTTPSLYELATDETKKNNNSNKYGNVNMFINTKVTALTRHGDFNIEVTSESTAKPKENDDESKPKMKSTKSAVEETHRKYDFTVCTVPVWNTGIMTLKGFKQAGVPLSTQTALETAHWIRSAKVFIPLKEAFWITHKDVLSPVIVSDTILQDCYCLLAPSTEEEKKENPNHLQGGICLLAYCWQDNAQRFLSFQQKDLVKLLVSKINQVWSNSGITDYKFEDFCVDPTFEREGAYSVWCWSLQEGYHGCAKAYLAGYENSNSLLLNFNNYFAKKSQLYFAGDAYGNESGWIETGALRLSVDCVLNIINNDADAELEDFDGTFDFEKDYYHPNLLSTNDAQKNYRLGPNSMEEDEEDEDDEA